MLGPEHPDMAQSLDNLATLCRSKGKYELAKPLYQRALAIYQQQLGTQHSQTLAVRGNYADLLKKVGQDGETTLLKTDQELP